MISSELKLLSGLRRVSRISAISGVFISLLLMQFFPNEIGWQVAMAVVALVVGIPHGAVDHLVTVPKLASFKMFGFLVAYLAVTGLAIWFLLSFNLLGFQLIVLISALHFGVGDASFLSELEARSSRTNFPKVIYSLAAGITPVGIPLVGFQAEAALTAVNPALKTWSGGFSSELFVAFVALNLIATVVMFATRARAQAIDLLLLLALALIAPPLVAFAFYFGLWHALRHTGRLSLELKASQVMHRSDRPAQAFWQAVLPGLAALAIVLAFTLILGLTRGFSLPNEFLWYLLVVVWALTIPHMILTARLDFRALRGSATTAPPQTVGS
jgi:Brp/Blh family beta-carotene 15,15'-monooxygenase